MNQWLFETKYGIDAAVDLFLAGEDRYPHPMYLVGLVLPASRGGGLHLAALVAHGGGVVGAFGVRPESRRRRGDTEFEFSGSYSAEGLAADSDRWFRRFGGWSQFPFFDTGREVASKIVEIRLLLGMHEESLQSEIRALRESIAGHTATGRAACEVTNYDSVSFSNAVALLDRAEVVAIEPLAFSARELDPWVGAVSPDVLALFMRTPYENALSTGGLPPDQATSVGQALANARGVELIDRRASVVLLRSGAEVLLEVIEQRLSETLEGSSLSSRTDALARYWKHNRPQGPASGDPRPVVESEVAVRAQIIASLHVVRDTGNLVHGDNVIDATAVALAFREYEKLAAAVGTLGTT